ncbi:MAG: hypothetical protein JST59_01910 [Actinobacteria bacterium]|nr:hypothetical protein [Actinomycetota bacterium]
MTKSEIYPVRDHIRLLTEPPESEFNGMTVTEAAIIAMAGKPQTSEGLRRYKTDNVDKEYVFKPSWTQSNILSRQQQTTSVIGRSKPRPQSSITQYQQLQEKSMSLCERIKSIAPDVEQYNDHATPIEWKGDKKHEAEE